jgi:hypothetical protein
MDGYGRAKFPHWAGTGTPRCDAGEVAKLMSGDNVVRDAECAAVSGQWVSPYDGIAVSDPAQLEVDHLVPLAEAWRSGAAGWTRAERKRFANDLDGELVTVTAHINHAKGGKDPCHWQPPVRAYWREYARGWIEVKRRYGLTMNACERDQLVVMLGTVA